MNLRCLCAFFIRVILSLIFAAIFYTGWLAVAIGAFKTGLDNLIVKAILWLSAPAVTAVGFATGIAIFELLPGARKSKFLDVLKWSLIGCAIGAVAVWWFGPMLIVFGMYAAGTASIVLREVLVIMREDNKVVPITNRGTISKRTVAFFDVLGFKSKIAENALDALAVKYEKIMIDTAGALNRPLLKNHGQTTLFPSHPYANPWCIKYLFSDTIILVSDEENEESCLKLLVYAWKLTQLLIAADMPPRGGITFGEIYMNQAENVVLGSALTGAYELEREQEWIGVAIDESVEYAFPKLFEILRDSENILSEVFMRYKVPLKKRPMRDLHTLNWRYNMVVEKGTRSLFAREGNKDIMEKVNHTLDYAKTVVDRKRVYARGPEVPIELRTFHVSPSPPGDHPFKHGDDL